MMNTKGRLLFLIVLAIFAASSALGMEAPDDMPLSGLKRGDKVKFVERIEFDTDFDFSGSRHYGASLVFEDGKMVLNTAMKDDLSSYVRTHGGPECTLFVGIPGSLVRVEGSRVSAGRLVIEGKSYPIDRVDPLSHGKEIQIDANEWAKEDRLSGEGAGSDYEEWLRSGKLEYGTIRCFNPDGPASDLTVGAVRRATGGRVSFDIQSR